MVQKIHIIAAIGRGRELGKANQLLWRIPDDLKRFKALTIGHPIIMGRKTFDSIGRPLPDRTNIVITRDQNWQHEGVTVAHSLDDALQNAGDDDVFVIGGAQIYAEALQLADVLHLTLIDNTKEADTFFPPYETEFTHVLSDEPHEFDGLRYRWVDIAR